MPSLGRVFGCEVTRTVALPDGWSASAVKIVRYAEKLPSAMTFEIDIHELCHAIASVQKLADPCHAGNGGMVQSVAPRRRAIP